VLPKSRRIRLRRPRPSPRRLALPDSLQHLSPHSSRPAQATKSFVAVAKNPCFFSRSCCSNSPVPVTALKSDLKSQILNSSRHSHFKPSISFLPGSVFARAPMILPGMPSGRPCALAKTPARTRKHCDFFLLPLRKRESDNAHLITTLSKHKLPCDSQIPFCLLNTV